MVLTDQARNIEAIALYIGEQEPARTPEASAVRDEWQRFYSSLGEFERNYEQQAYDRARNLRLAFNRANATTPEEHAAVEEQALHGVTTEQLDGKADRRRADGSYVPPPSGSTQLQHVAIGLGLVLGLVLILRR
jgi:hypothetical protein